jgi:hypothetical protein
MTLKSLFAIFISVTCLSSCSGTYHTYYETLELAFSEPQNATMELEEVANSKIDLMSVTRGERPAVIMALAFIENNQHKWVSSDEAMLIMEKGRIVRTVGLENNVTYMSNIAADPLQQRPMSINQKEWEFSLDWSNNQFGYPVASTFSKPSAEQLHVLSKDITTDVFTENLVYQAQSDYIHIQTEWSNTYWFDKKTGELIKAKVTLSPLSEPIEMIYLSRIARLDA